MAKRIEENGKFYRIRRGKVVELPPEWVGRAYHGKTSWNWYSKGFRRAEKSRERNQARVELRGQLKEGGY